MMIYLREWADFLLDDNHRISIEYLEHKYYEGKHAPLLVKFSGFSVLPVDQLEEYLSQYTAKSGGGHKDLSEKAKKWLHNESNKITDPNYVPLERYSHDKQLYFVDK